MVLRYYYCTIAIYTFIAYFQVTTLHLQLSHQVEIHVDTKQS